MGEEIKEQIPQESQSQENQQEEIQQQENISDFSKENSGTDFSAVKVLRQKLEEEIKKRKELEKELQKRDEFLRVANLDELISTVEKLSVENYIAKKFPQLIDEVDEILKIRKQGEDIEETVYKYLGKKTIETSHSETGFSLGSRKISSTPSENTKQLSKEEAGKIFRKIFGLSEE